MKNPINWFVRRILPEKFRHCKRANKFYDSVPETKIDLMLNNAKLIALALLLIQVISPWTTSLAQVRNEKTPYPVMAPLNQYLMDKNAEIALARSAAPPSISDNAEVLVLEGTGYTIAVKGTNGFVCIVERSWTLPTDDPEFWNSKLRAPNCFNPQAARTYLPFDLMKTKLVLEGKSKSEIKRAIASAFDKKELPAIEPGAMCYMMSKQQYLNDEGKSWHPHLMFYLQGKEAKSWGADLPDSPVMSGYDSQVGATIFMVWVGKWSDGTLAPPIH
jgi:hypothetical protein